MIVGDLMKSITLLFYKAAEGALEVGRRCVGGGGKEERKTECVCMRQQTVCIVS